MAGEMSRAELIAAVDEIFTSMAGMQLTPSEASVPSVKDGAYVVSAVQIVGSWRGAVRLDIDIELARQACARLLAVDASQLSQEDIRDAAGELANITAGSVKAVLAPTCTLSLPTVVIGREYAFSLPQGKVMEKASLGHESGNLLVSIIEKQGSSHPPDI